MKKLLLLAGVFVSAVAAAQQAAYQIDLAPSGKLMSKDAPVLRGNTYLFHSYPDGTLMSLRRSDVKGVAKVAPDAVLAKANSGVIAIGNLAMQGGTSQGGPTNAAAVGAAKRADAKQELGKGFYSDLKMGQSLAPDAGAANDYAIGRSYAYAPATASQSSPGAPPTNPSTTSGTNPPTMSGTASGTNPQ